MIVHRGVLVTGHVAWYWDATATQLAAQRCEPISSTLGQAATMAVSLANGLHSTDTSHGHRHLGDLTAAACKHRCEASAVLSYCCVYPGSQNMRETTKRQLSTHWGVFALWLGAHHNHKRNVPVACLGLTSAHPLYGSSPGPAVADSPSSRSRKACQCWSLLLAMKLTESLCT